MPKLSEKQIIDLLLKERSGQSQRSPRSQRSPITEITESKRRDDDIKNYYETLDLTKVKNPKNLNDELMYQLYRTPVEKYMPKYSRIEKDNTNMCDLLYLPDDDGYKYALVVVDVGSRLCDAQPMKNRMAKTTLEAIKAIYKRGILSMPFVLKCDDGSEFKSTFAKYFKDIGVELIVAQPNRHRQVAIVEARNRAIGSYLLKRMTAQELKTGETSREWVKWLPKILTTLNKRLEVKNPKPNESNKMKCDGINCDILEIGDEVRFKLDRPIDVVNGKPIDKRFRASDIKFSLKPTSVKYIRMSPDNQPLYALDGQHAFYTREQLIKVEDSKLPPASLQDRFTVEKIIGKEKIKGRIYYKVIYKGYKEPELTLGSLLRKDVPVMVADFEKLVY